LIRCLPFKCERLYSFDILQWISWLDIVVTYLLECFSDFVKTPRALTNTDDLMGIMVDDDALTINNIG